MTPNTTKWKIQPSTLIFWAICLVAIAVRVWKFGAVPGGFNQDGAMAAVDAKALADYGTDRFGMPHPVYLTGWGISQMSALLSYAMVPFIKIWGLNETTARLPQLLFSIAGLAALYGLIKDTMGRHLALTVLFLASINPWHIMQSRWAIDCNVFPHLLIIGCYLLNLGRKRVIYLYLSMVSFALSMYSYGVAFFTVPFFLGFLGIYFLIKKQFKWYQVLISVGVYTLIALPGWLVMLVNFLKIPSIQTPLFIIPLFPENARSQNILFFASDFAEQLETNASALLNVGFFQMPDLPWNAINAWGTQYLFALPLVILGIATALTESCCTRKAQPTPKDATEPLFRERHAGYTILLAGLAVGIWTGLIVESVNVNRLNIIFYFLIALAGIGLYRLSRWSKPVFAFGLLLYTISFAGFTAQYFGSWSHEIREAFFDGFGQALRQVKNIDTPVYYITVNTQYQGAKPVSEILTMFHHRIDAHYFQGIGLNKDVPPPLAQIPYAQRYRYVDPAQMNIDPNAKAVYVVNAAEDHLFDTSKFQITRYKNYSVATPIGMNQSFIK